MSTLPELLLIGGGGNCRSCIDVIEAEGEYKIAGIVNQSGGSREQTLGYDVLGDDEDLPKLLKKYQNALITVGQIKSADLRLKLFLQVQKLALELKIFLRLLLIVFLPQTATPQSHCRP